MPNKGSWNGKWTGEGHDYYIIRKLDKNKCDAIMGNDDKKSWYYNFGDGWGALVSAEIIDSMESKKRMKKSIGFCGYDWMIEEIEKYGKILGL